MIVLSLLLCLLSVHAVCADTLDNVAADDMLTLSDSDDFNLDSPQTDDVLAADGDKSFSQLQDEITNDTSGTISLNDNYEYNDADDASLVNGIVISKDLTIQGNGHTVDAKNLAKIFNIDAQATVVLTNITFVNGFSDDSSGAIYSSGDVILTVDNCIFTNNHGAYGGAIWAEGTTTITNSQFTDNSATKDGGALNIIGEDCVLANSTFKDNTADDDGGLANWRGNGGIIYNITSVNNNGISSGTSHTKGGAICFNGNDASISKSSFSGSNGAYNGGAIFITGNNVNITDTEFKNCSSDVNKAVSGDDEPYGGALYILGDDTLVGNCTFEDCKAVNGGVIYVLGQNATISDSEFTKNSATADGGVIYVEGSGAVISGSTFTDNSATKDGGVLNVIGEDCVLANSTFKDNTAGDDGGLANWRGNGGIIYNITSVNNNGISSGTSHTKGGAICLNGNDTSISKSSFSGSNGAYNGGAIFITGNNVNITDIEFKNCSSDVNKAVSGDDEPYGGALYILGDDTLVGNCTFEDCKAVNGGVIYVLGQNATISDSEFTKNSATADGGVIYVEGSDAVISGSTFTDNSATKDGGVLNIIGVNCVLANSTFTDNTAGDDGGLANWRGNGGIIYNITSVNNNGISSGTSHTKGGAICLNGNDTSISKSSFSDSNGAYNGGAIFITGNNVNITDTEFKNCSSDVKKAVSGDDEPYGGALYILGSNTDVINCSFDDCKAVNGGVIYISGEDAFISDSTFNSASATKSGGAIYIVGERATINDSNFTNTNSVSPGGAIYVKGSNAVINGSDFTDSSAKSNGGAIYVDGKNTNVNGSSFLRCTAVGYEGGAIYINNEGTNISHSNFTSSQAKTAGAIYINGKNTTIEYCNLDENIATGSAGAIRVHGDDTILLYNNFTNNLAKSGDGGALDIGGENASVYYCSFDNNDAKSNGGAINWIGGHGSDSIIGSNFTNNTCHNTNNGGGAIYWTAGNVISSGGLIKDCVFINNTAAAKHGGAVNWFRTKDSTITNCTFIGNTAASDGGALYTGDKSGGSVNLTISDSRFYNNTANKHGGAIANQMSYAYIYNNTFDGNKANSSGGTILIKEASGSNSIIDHCNITNSYVHSPINTAYGEGGGAIRIGHYGKGGDENITISNCLIINSTTGETYGGAISVQTNNCKLENVTIINSTSKNHQGGAIQWSGSNGMINNVNITNSSTHTDGTRTAGNANGGAIYWTGTNGNLNNVTITNAYTNSTNSKSAHGGAIYVDASNTYLNNISVNDSYASGVNDNAYGGAIYLNGNKYYYITNATLINNTAVKGGAIYGAGSQTRLSDSLLRNNSADDGGALYLQGGGHIVDNVDILNNTATNGGGVYFKSTTSGTNMISNSNISYNKAFKGSGIYGESSQFKLENDILLDNQAHSNKFINKFINYDESTGNYTIGATFLGYDNEFNGIWIDSGSIRSVKNLTYWDVGGENIANSVPTKSDKESWQNITVERYDENGNLISSKTVTVKTDKNGQFKVDVGPGINSKDSFKFIHYEDNYYTYIYDTISNVTVIKVTADDIYIGQNSSIKINLTDGAGKPLTGNVTFKLNATGFSEWTVEVLNGTAYIYNITGLALGTYNASALFAPNSTYFGSIGWDTFKVLPIVFLEINKTVAPNHVKVGESVVYTINVTNSGPCNATCVNVTDIVPEQFRVTAVSKATIVTAGGKREYDVGVSGNNITAIIEKLNVGESAIINVTAVALANGTWNNTARTVCNENETEKNSTVNVTVDPVVNFAIVKTSNATLEANATVGSLVNFTITVTNIGPSNATNVTVSDVLNSGFEYVGSEGSYDNATRKVTWKFNKLNYGENVTVWVMAKALTNGFLPNTAHVNSTENTTGASNKTTAIIYPVVNITLVKKSNVTIKDNASVGALVNFTISIINFGPSNATNVNVTDVLGSEFEYVDSKGSYDNATRKITWNIGDFNFGDSTSVWVVVRAVTNGFLPNVAKVNSTENKTGCENKTTVVIYPAVNITLVKKSNLTENAKVGELVNFTISIVNYGPSNSTDVNISDVLEDAFEYVDSKGSYDNATRKITWNIGNLDYGASTSVWVVVKVLNNGTFENVASVNSTENTTGTSNKTNITADPVVNWTLVKTSNLTANAKVYDLVNFTITVTNLGPSNATDVNVSDVLKDVFEYVDSEGSYDNATRKVTWNIAKLDNGSSVSVWVVVKVLANGTFENVASVNSTENTTGTSNKTNVTVDPVVNLTLVKKSNLTANAKVYDLVNFTITVTNNGPSNATNVNISDVLGDAFGYDSSNGAYDKSSNKVTWTINKINNGTSASVWVVVKVLANGTFENIATANCSENDTNVSNKTNVTVDPVVNFTIIKKSNATVLDNASVGDIINFTITITNIGPSNATNVNITDTLISAFEYVNSTGNYDNVTRMITWNIGDLNYGDNATVWVTVKALTNGFFRNDAHVNSTEDPIGATNGTTVVIYPAVNMTLIKKSNVTLQSNSSVYDLVNFTITITNYGPSDATNVNISDVLDDAFEYVDSDGHYDNSTRKITWNVGDLNYGNTTSVWVLVKALTNGTFENVAHVNSTENKTGTSNKTNVTVDPVVNLTIIKKSNLTANAKVGDLVNFTITVTNLGPSNATNVTISDVLDDAFEFVDSHGIESNHKVTWTIDKIENGTSVSVWVVVRVLTNGTFENVATVNCGENTTDVSNKTNVTVDPVVNLTLVKTSNVTGNAKVNDLVNFTITVTNNGPSNATNVNVSDVLDAAFGYDSSNGVYDKSNNRVTWTVNMINNGSSVSVWVVVKVLTNGTFVNVATVNCSENTTGTSNKTNVTVDPVVNLTLVKVSNVTGNAKVNDLVNFTITITNNGPSNATDVNISDMLDGAFGFVGSDGVESNGKVTWTINKINNGTSVSVWVVVKVLTNGTFENVATVNCSENDTEISNKTNVTVDPVVNLTLVKTSNLTGNAKVNDLVNFTITIINNGPSNATDVNVSDVLDAAFGYDSSNGVYDKSNNMVTWTINKIENGSSVSVWVVVKVLTNGTFENVATANSNENGTDVSNKTNVTVDPVVNFTIVKKSNATIENNVSVGGLVNFTITITNVGPSNATNVAISDVLNSGFEYVGSKGDYDNATHKVTWKFNKLNNGESVTVWVTAKALTNGFLPNTAHVNSTENTTGVSNKTTAIIFPAVNITLVKKSNVTMEDNASVGSLVNFTITVTNHGPSNATGVNVTDVLGPEFEYVDSQGSYDNATRKVTWNIGKLDNGSSVSVWIVARAKTNGFLPNVAKVNSTENKTGCENKTTVVIYPAVNITLVKKSNLTENAKVGDLVNFTIAVTNHGPSNAADVTISDVLDAAFEYVSSEGNYDNATRKVTWNIAKLSNGSSVSVWVVVKVLTNGTFVNVASVNSTENTTGTSNKTNVTADPVVNLTLVKTSNVTGNAKVGDLVNFTITITNNGPSNATGVNVSDVLDGAFGYDSSNGVYDKLNNKVTWTINKINNGSSVSVWVVVKVLTNGTFENAATASSTENDTEVSNKTNVTADPVVNLTLVKASNLTENANIYDLVNFTITVTNLGPSNATDVTISDILDSAFEYVGSEGSYDNATRKLTWNIAKLSNGSSVSVWVVVKVLANGTFVNVASVNSTENTTGTSNKTNVTVNPAKSLVNGTDKIVVYGEPISIEVDSVNATNITYKIIDENGNVVANGTVGPHGPIADLGVLPVGNYTVNLTTVVDEHHTVATNQSKLTVLPANSTVSGKDVVVDYGNPITVDVTSENATEIIYKIIDENGNVVANGTIKPGEDITGLDLAVGNYTVNLTTVTDKNHISSNNQSKITVNKAPSKVDVNDTTINHGDVAEIPIKSENATGVTYEIIDKDGNVVAKGNTTDDIINVPGLKPGEYTIKVTTIVDENHTSTTSEAKITVMPIVDLELTKKVDKTNIKEGEKVTYTLTVKNNGPSDATGVKVTDKAVAQHKFVSASSDAYDSRTGVWSIGDLANGSSVTLTVTVIIEKAGTYGNTAFVSSNENDTNMSNNNASSKDVVVTKDNHTDENETTNETTPQKAEVPTMHETGNPIFALLVVLMALILPQLRRYKK